MFLSAQQPRGVEIAPTTLPAQFWPIYHHAVHNAFESTQWRKGEHMQPV